MPEPSLVCPFCLHPVIDTGEGVCECEEPRRALTVNPDPLEAVVVKRCSVCGKKAPWCSCGKGDYR